MLWANEPFHVAANLNVANGRQLREAVNGLEGRVVDNGHVALDRLQGLEGNIGQLLVVDECETGGDAGEVVGGNRQELGAVIELDRADLTQQAGIECLDLAEFDLAGSLQSRHVHLYVVAVVDKLERLGHVDKVGVERNELAVVGDVDGVSSGDIEAAKVTDEGVGNLDVCRLCDTRSAKGEAVELREANEADGVDLLERRELQPTQEREAFSRHDSANRGDGAAGDADELGGAGNIQVALDLLGTLDAQAASQLLVNVDIGIDDIAVNDWCGLGDEDILSASRGTCEKRGG